MPIIEYFLLALLGSTASVPAAKDASSMPVITLGEDVIVQPSAGAPSAAGGFQKKPVKNKEKGWIKGHHRRGHHRGSTNRNGAHVKPDALTVKQKVHQD